MAHRRTKSFYSPLVKQHLLFGQVLCNLMPNWGRAMKRLILLATFFSLYTYAANQSRFDPTERPRWMAPKQDKVLQARYAPVRLLSPKGWPDLALIDGNLKDLKQALQNQLERCQKLSQTQRWTFGRRVISLGQWCTQSVKRTLQIANRSHSMRELYLALKSDFQLYQSTGKNGDGRIFYTGYYLPKLYGSYQKTDRFFYPLYLRPHNLVRVFYNGRYYWRKRTLNGRITYFDTRYRIDFQSSLLGQNLEIVYVDNMIDAFFLHIQGSGLVEIEQTQEVLSVGYNAQNGQPYVSIGSILINEGVRPEYTHSLQGLKRYFEERPYEIARVFPKNPSYIFFKAHRGGAQGSYGGPVTPLHSIATDNNVYPLGAIGIIKTVKPIVRSGEIVGWLPYIRLVLNQDTGGAIRGASRVDVFWGSGDYAEIAAGHSRHNGELYWLLPQ